MSQFYYTLAQTCTQVKGNLVWIEENLSVTNCCLRIAHFMVVRFVNNLQNLYTVLADQSELSVFPKSQTGTKILSIWGMFILLI